MVAIGNMKKKVLFIVNPKSGKGAIRGKLLDIIDTFVKAEFDLTVYVSQFAGDAREKVKEVEGKYELETGNVIVKRFEGINPDHTPGVLVKNHGPFTWGTSPANAVYNAKVLEQCAKMAFISFAINPETTMNPLLIEKHYSRKHGPNAYYGQKK